MSVYLLHFSAPLAGHAEHYMGSAGNLADRIGQHERGEGARITAVAVAAGITFTVARTWPGGRVAERKLKGRKIGSSHLRRKCPVCQPMPRINRWAGGQP